MGPQTVSLEAPVEYAGRRQATAPGLGADNRMVLHMVDMRLRYCMHYWHCTQNMAMGVERVA